MIKISTLFSLSPSAVGGGTLTDGVKNGTLLLLSSSVVGRRTLTGGVENSTKGGVDTGAKSVVQTWLWGSFEVDECNGLCVGTSCLVLRSSLIEGCLVFEDEGW